MQFMNQWVPAAIIGILCCADAHSQESTFSANCSNPALSPAFEAYHIHVLFWPDGDGTMKTSSSSHDSDGAMRLRSSFLDQFGITDKANCTSLSDPAQGLCAFPVDFKPGYGFAHPFITPNFALFVPLGRFKDTIPWMMKNRGNYDVLVHPNSGCMLQDHTNSAFWMGQKGELRLPDPNPTPHQEP